MLRSSAACVLGGAVDLVREDHVREDRAGQKRKLASAGFRIVLKNVGTGDVRGHQVRRELDALERKMHNAGERADEQRLGQARHADEQAMPAAEHGHDHLFDDLVLPDDHLADLVGHPFVGGSNFLDRLDFGRRHRVVFREGTDRTGRVF